MPHTSETPRDGGVSRNSCGGWFRDIHSRETLSEQPLPDLIAIHLGRAFRASWAGKEAVR